MEPQHLPSLATIDVQRVLMLLPKDVTHIMKKHGLILAGGFIRSVVAREDPNDIDLWGSSTDTLNLAATELAMERGVKMHSTLNAFSVITPGRMSVQFIYRWRFDSLDDIVNSFDFTIVQAAIQWFPDGKSWHSRRGRQFYEDMAAKRLNYTAPERDEDAAGSILRVLKYHAKGYHIELGSYARVIARLLNGVKNSPNFMKFDEIAKTMALSGLMREVDPLMVVDGVEAAPDHPDANENIDGGSF